MGRVAPGEFAYRQVYRYLEALIDQAASGGPCRLPSLRTLSRRLRVSLATVQSAYSLLEEEGRVRCLPRSGYYVQHAGTVQAVITPCLPPCNRCWNVPCLATNGVSPASGTAASSLGGTWQHPPAQCIGRALYPFFQPVLVSR